MTDFRARCAELVAAMDTYPIRPKAHRDLCNQVRRELAQPVLKEPTNEELTIFAYKNWKGNPVVWARAVLAHYGTRP